VRKKLSTTLELVVPAFLEDAEEHGSIEENALEAFAHEHDLDEEKFLERLGADHDAVLNHYALGSAEAVVLQIGPVDTWYLCLIRSGRALFRGAHIGLLHLVT